MNMTEPMIITYIYNYIIDDHHLYARLISLTS